MPKTRTLFLTASILISCLHGNAQMLPALDLKSIIELAKLDRFEMAEWANKQDLHPQIVTVGDVEVRHWVVKGSPEEARIEFGSSACSNISAIRGGFGYFWMSFEGEQFENLRQRALQLGFIAVPIANEESFVANSSPKFEFEDITLMRYTTDRSNHLESKAELMIASCNGWMEIKYVP